jgi:hypothetical protein
MKTKGKSKPFIPVKDYAMILLNDRNFKVIKYISRFLDHFTLFIVVTSVRKWKL